MGVWGWGGMGWGGGGVGGGVASCDFHMLVTFF